VLIAQLLSLLHSQHNQSYNTDCDPKTTSLLPSLMVSTAHMKLMLTREGTVVPLQSS
jgi:hypothetical protein